MPQNRWEYSFPISADSVFNTASGKSLIEDNHHEPDLWWQLGERVFRVVSSKHTMHAPGEIND